MPESTRREFLGGVGALAGAMVLPVPFARAEPGPVDHEPPLPKGVFRRLGSGRFRHAEACTSIAFSPDGKFLLTTLLDQNVRVWNVGTGRPVAVLPLSEWKIQTSCVTQSNEAKWIVEENGGLSLVRVDLSNGKTLEHRPWPGIGVGGAFHFQFNPQGNRLLAHSIESTYGFDPATRKILWQQAPMPGVWFSGDGQRIFTKWKDGRLNVLDACTGVVRGEFDLEDFTPVAISYDGTRVILSKIAGKFTLLLLQDITRGELWRANIGEGKPHDLAFSPDGSKILYGLGETLQWQVFDAATEKLLHTLRGTRDCAAFSPDSKSIATFAEGRIAFFDSTTGKMTAQNVEEYGQWTKLQFVSNTRIQLKDRPLEEGSRDSWIHFDALTDATSSITLRKGSDTYFPIALSPDEKTYLFNGSTGLELYKAWDAKPIRTLMPRSGVFQGEASSFRISRWSRDGNTVFVPSLGGLYCVNAETGDTTLISMLGGLQESRVEYFRVSRSENVAVALHTAKDFETDELFQRLYIYDFKQQKCRTIPGNYQRLLGLSADGRTALLSKTDAETNTSHSFILDVSSERVELLHSHGDVLELSPDGRTVVLLMRSESASHIGLFEIASQSLRWRSPEVHSPTAVALSPDGRTLLSQHVDAPVYLWDVYGDKTDRLPKPGADAWKQLGDPNGEVAFRVIRQLVQHPAEAVAYLEKHLKPAAELTPVETAGFIERLGHPEYRTREASQAWLADRADIAAKTMRDALRAGEPNAERQRRLEILLGNTPRPTKRMLAHLRALEVLEMIQTAEAKALVAKIAGGAAEAILTHEAAAAGARMKDLRGTD